VTIFATFIEEALETRAGARKFTEFEQAVYVLATET